MPESVPRMTPRVLQDLQWQMLRMLITTNVAALILAAVFAFIRVAVQQGRVLPIGTRGISLETERQKEEDEC